MESGERESERGRMRVLGPVVCLSFTRTHTRLASPRHALHGIQTILARDLRFFSQILHGDSRTGDTRRLAAGLRQIQMTDRETERERDRAHALSSQPHALNLREESAKETKSKTKIHI